MRDAGPEAESAFDGDVGDGMGDGAGGEVQARFAAIRDALISAIHNRAYQPGSRLPSVRLMGDQWGVSLSTVVHAYRALEHEGLVRSEPRRGFFVVDRPPGARAEPERDPGTELAPGASGVRQLVAAESGAVGDNCPWANGTLHPDRQPHRLMAGALRSVARSTSSGEFAAPEPAGHQELRNRISQQLHVAGLPVAADELLIANGSSSGLELMFDALLKPGDHVALQGPVPPMVLHMAELRMLRFHEVPSTSRGISLDVLEYLCESQPLRALLLWPRVLPTTGWSMTAEQLRTAIELAARCEAAVICDHSFDPLVLEPRHQEAGVDVAGTADVLRCGSLAAQFGTSMPMAWLAPGRYYNELVAAKLMRGDHGQRLLEEVAAGCLGDEGWLQFSRQLRHQLQNDHRFFEQRLLPAFPAGTKAPAPGAGYMRWIELPGGALAPILDAAEVAGIRFVHGSVCSSIARYNDCLRFNVAGIEAEWVERLAPVLQAR